MDRINAGRRLINARTTRFDKTRCAKGLEVLRSYKQEFDSVNRVFRKQPKHDWASHGADAWGHLSVSVDDSKIPEKKTVPFTGVKAQPLTVNDLLNSRRGDGGRWA